MLISRLISELLWLLLILRWLLIVLLRSLLLLWLLLLVVLLVSERLEAFVGDTDSRAGFDSVLDQSHGVVLGSTGWLWEAD